MKNLKAALIVLACSFFYPAIVSAQVDLSLKARGTGFYGKFGQTYAAIGYEPGITIKPSVSKPWAGGVSYSKNILGYDANSNLEADMNLVTFHLGGKGSIGKYVHPFAYALLGFRFMSYDNDDIATDDDPLFTSFSLGYGTRAGLQIGSGKWRFEGSIEFLTGTRSRYLTPESFEKAADSGQSYRDFTYRSPIMGLSVGAGVAYVFSWSSLQSDLDE
ncbi:hypothetical protein H8S95_01110 [Pontibacter sp. KCTC 32443]|uniref:hypothetical protein n=1 Tax=Pontibacter TaxID=323449 RepID=UPI00164D1B43|nr:MULTISPECIES: hypothetical protein [Pontibacter]MBC5772646.1 hypothetical protein [Pontibacter sp. KCTC 32443]